MTSDGELLLHRGLPEIPIHRPSSLCSSRTPSNADSQKSISLMNILSTVEEEDPTNLTVHQQEDSRRGTICEVRSAYASLMDKSKVGFSAPLIIFWCISSNWFPSLLVLNDLLPLAFLHPPPPPFQGQ